MAKKKSRKDIGKPISARSLSLLKRYRWYGAGLLGISLLVFGLYMQRPEDLGAQLPPPPADALYKQANQPIDVRVQDLLSRMTLEEKIGQMALVDKNSVRQTEDVSKYYIGGLLSGAGAKPENNTADGWLEMINTYKDQAKQSRLGIPIFYGVDANHGHANVIGATVFPHAIGLGASQDKELVRQVAEATAQELLATGVNWSFSPSLDAPKDIRWGRVYEAFSDDHVLNGSLGASYITGTQGHDPTKTFVLATAKHYLGTGSMEWGKSNHKIFKIDQGIVEPDEQLLYEEFLPPYKAAVEAGVGSVMVGLNEWGDTRIIDSPYLITEKLKGELGFKGIVVSDWYGVYEYAGTTNYKANVKAINAGLDMAMLPYDYKSFLFDVRKAVRNGDIEESRINDAVGRILYQKFKAGLFDGSTSTPPTDIVGSKEHRNLARRAVSSSAVLLKNVNSTLPINDPSKTIFVAGSGADNVGRQSGAWTVEWQGVDGNWLPGTTSVFSGLKQSAENPGSVRYKEDALFNGRADIGIAVVSEKPYAEGWGDHPNPGIDPADEKVIERLRAKCDSLVIVVLSGRPLFMNEQIKKADAVVAAWLPGSEGSGVADVLLGKQPFKGRLPINWPADVSHLSEANGSQLPLFSRYYSL